MTVIGNTSGGGTPTEVSVIDNITDDASTSSIATSQAIKDYVDANGGGGSSFYQDIDNIEKFDQVADTEYTYQLSNFNGTGYDASKVNGVYVECYLTIGNGDFDDPTIESNLGGGSNWVTLHKKYEYEDAGVGTLVFLPLSKGQTSFKLRMSKAGDDTDRFRKGWRIVGVSQIDGSVGGGSGGTSSGGSSSSLLRYGEIQVGDIGSGTSGNVTTIGDFTTVKHNNSHRSHFVCTFNTPISNTNYNVLVEKISLNDIENDGDLKSHVVYNKSTTGFTISQDESESTVQDLQFNVRIESTEATTVYNGEESVTLPNGMIMKTGVVNALISGVQVNFAEPFPNGVVSAFACINSSVQITQSTGYTGKASVNALNVNSVTVRADGSTYWQAIGY